MVLLSTDTQLLSTGMEKNKTAAKKTSFWMTMHGIHLKNHEGGAPDGR